MLELAQMPVKYLPYRLQAHISQRGFPLAIRYPGQGQGRLPSRRQNPPTPSEWRAKPAPKANLCCPGLTSGMIGGFADYSLNLSSIENRYAESPPSHS